MLVVRGVPVMAMLRLPTRASGGRANLHQGAIGVGVDLATGVTAGGVLRGRRVDRHPDTLEPLGGVELPQWEAVLEVASRLGPALGLGYVGVDIVLDPKRGPVVLEANARPGLTIQAANGRGLRSVLEDGERTGPAVRCRSEPRTLNAVGYGADRGAARDKMPAE